MAKKVSLTVEGMSCEHCAAAVTSALKGVEGVKSAKVKLKKKFALAAGVDLDPQKLVEAVTGAGYTAQVTEAK
ncbi:MAG: heavy-metal-associated domain-containing protein [Spirochaetales bacterium]|jgi:copper chaperone CopZ|nr:heavy-metal-associated domain-containing protein [Spirochaetales bacterium]